jgi:hypothetical protein
MLKEFLDLEQGKHSVFDYTRQFNTLAQYGSYHVDTDEKKSNLYHERLTVHLQERLGLPPTCRTMNWQVPPSIKIGKCRHWPREADEGHYWGQWEEEEEDDACIIYQWWF